VEINTMLPYNLKEIYNITPNAEAAEFIQAEVQNYFGYQQKSKREKYADVWINENLGLNVKTDNLISDQNKGRLCTAEVNQWLRDKNNDLKFLFVRYKNQNGLLTLIETNEVYIEEIEYEISNQGRGLLQPKRTKNGEVNLRQRISRDEWIDEFKNKYAKFVDKQILKFENYKKQWC
jgi:hypothetical protein